VDTFHDLFYHKLRGVGHPISTWLSLVCDEKYYIPSNDFSIMISTTMFIPELDALQYVPGAINEGCHKWVEVYHKAQSAGKAIEVFCTF
jgi:hypothetical protein